MGLGLEWALETLTPTSSAVHPLTRANVLVLPKAVLPFRDRAFKHMGLWAPKTVSPFRDRAYKPLGTILIQTHSTKKWKRKAIFLPTCRNSHKDLTINSKLLSQFEVKWFGFLAQLWFLLASSGCVFPNEFNPPPERQLKEYVTGPAKWLGRQRCLQPSLTIWVQSSGPTWRKGGDWLSQTVSGLLFTTWHVAPLPHDECEM